MANKNGNPDWYKTDGFNKRLPIAFMNNAPKAIKEHLAIQKQTLNTFGFADTELAIIDTPGKLPQIVPAKL